MENVTIYNVILFSILFSIIIRGLWITSVISADTLPSEDSKLASTVQLLQNVVRKKPTFYCTEYLQHCILPQND